MTTTPDRHARQARFGPIGEEGQRRIAQGRVAIVGCGALGSVAADLLVRAGIGTLRIVDRDACELSNLHRQALFTEADVAEGLPKAVAAAARLRAVDGAADIEPVVADLDGANARELLKGVGIVLDGTDNFEARHVLNEACLEMGLPWIHGAVLGSTAVAWPLTPPRGPCFACAVPDVPAPGEVPTCETAGVIGPAVHLAASVQVAELLKMLCGRAPALDGSWTWDVWTQRGAVVRVEKDPGCAACARHERRFWGRPRQADSVACGRGAVQIASRGAVDLDAVVARVAGGPGPAPATVRNRWLARFPDGSLTITVFRDGRILVSGTKEPSEARAAAARWLGG